MSDRLLRILPWLALAGLLAVALGVVVGEPVFRAARTETGQTRAVVEESLSALVAAPVVTPDDPALLQALGELQQTPYVAGVWLFTADGRLIRASGSTAAATSKGRTALELATEETRRVVSALQDSLLGQDERLALFVAAAIQREGEHNDVYRHLVRRLRTADGGTAGYVGVSFAASASLDDPSMSWRAGVLASLVGLATYWLALPLWVLGDAARRGERAWVWFAFVLVGNLVALMAYLLTRVPRREGGQEARSGAGDPVH
ncbi:hypothetical protein ACFL6X_03835 [Candidatus Latescibacterota bacterium]